MAAVLASLRPAAPVPSAADSALVARLLDDEDADDPARAAALVTARAIAGDLPGALRCADRALARRPAAGDDPGHAVSLLLASAGAHVMAGWPRRSAPLAQRAMAEAERIGDDGGRYSAGGLLALSRALNGEYAGAREHLAECATLRARHDWDVAAADLPRLLAESLTTSAALDAEALGLVAAELERGCTDDPTWSLALADTQAMRLLVEGDHPRALALLQTVMARSDSAGMTPMLRGFAIGVRADLHLNRGEARRALTLLEGRTSPLGHALCFDMQRSSAYLMLGEDRQALASTDGCMQLGEEHCLRTIPPILLRRAIALLRLGHLEAADEAFAEALHLVDSSGSLTPFLTLPSDDLGTLLARATTAPAPLRDIAEALAARVHRVPRPDLARAALPRLTVRETVLARELRGDRPLHEIAAELHVSPNTVKTQVRSLYRKLGATSRGSALLRLERAGFFD